MSDEAALLHAIYANPDDDTPRLVYADWLDEHDQPERAEFIRVQVERDARTDHSSDEYQRLVAREAELLAAHCPAWRSHLGAFAEAMREERVEIGFVRGLPESLSLCDATVADFAILRQFPHLSEIEIRGSQLTPEVLSVIARFQNLNQLTTESTGFQSEWLPMLDPLPCWTKVNILEDLNWAAWLAFQERRVGKVVQLSPKEQRAAAIRYLRATRLNDSVRHNQPVTTVRLVQDGSTDADLRLLSYLPELEEVEIAYGRETAAGLEHLAALPNLRSVHLGRANTESLVPLTRCKTLESLEYTGNGFAELSDDGVAGLENLTRLKHLVLVGGRLRDATIRRVGALRELVLLDLDHERLEDENSLTALNGLTKLESLTLNGREYKGDELRRFQTRKPLPEAPTYALLDE
jgi:uncharacterized protein (TIGR02996 family)